MLMPSRTLCKRSSAEEPSLIQHCQQGWGLQISSDAWSSRMSFAVVAMATATEMLRAHSS